MLLWFVIVAPIAVAEVFRSPMVDYRLVAIGAVVPLVEVLIGRSIGSALVGGVGAVAGTWSWGRPCRPTAAYAGVCSACPSACSCIWCSTGPGRRLICFGGQPSVLRLGDETVPESGRTLIVLVLFEILAIGFGWWAWRRYELGDPDNRRILVRRRTPGSRRTAPSPRVPAVF